MPQYTHTTLSQARTALAARLQETANTYWLVPELNRTIVESLRMWQAVTASYRDRVQFVTTAQTPFYDLTSVLPLDIFGHNVTDTDLVYEIQSHLLEPSTGTTWAGTAQFTLAQVTAAMQRRRDQFLVDTGCLVRRSVLDVPSAPIGRVQIPDTIIDVRRAAWIGVDDTLTPLSREDEYAALAFQPGWVQSPDTPNSYSVSASPSVTLQLMPLPSDRGQLELVTVDAGATLNPAEGVELGIPDDFCWAVKWGTLADLLSSDGRSTDTARAQFAENMYGLGVAMAKANPTVLMTALNDIPLFTGSVFDFDSFTVNWQRTYSQPDSAAMIGNNLLAVSPSPDDVYGISLDLVRNMPIPSADDDYLQVGRESLEAILDIAQHICSFKMGTFDFAATQGLRQNFLRVAALMNNRIKATTFYNTSMNEPAVRYDKQVPRVESTFGQEK